MELFKNSNPNILKMFKELFKSSDLIKEFFMQSTLDEYYNFCTKIQSGYTKEELQAFFNDLILLAKKSEGGKIELDEELEQVCGGVDIKNFNRKFLSTFLSVLTLSEAFSVGAFKNPEKTNQKSMSLPTPLYSRNVTINKKKNQKSKFPEKEETMFNPVLIPGIGIAIGGLIIALSNSDSDSIPAGQFNAGLANTGNTCFSNALLQQLYSIKSFRRFIDSINSLEDLQQYDALKSIEDGNKILKKIRVFKKIFELMGTVKCVKEKNMIEYVSTALTGHIERKQDDINECFFQFLGDVMGLYQEFLTKGEIKDETKDEKNATPRSHCICGVSLKLPNGPTEWDNIFKFTFSKDLDMDELRGYINSNDDNFIDRYQQAYMQKYGYTDAKLEISLDSEKKFFDDLDKQSSLTDKEKEKEKEKLNFMRELVKYIDELHENNLFQKYILSTFYLKLKQTQLSFQSKERDTIEQRIHIYAAKAFSARQKLSEDDLNDELNSIFEVLNKLNKGKNLKFGSIEISKLNKLDGLNTPLYKESYNEATMLFKECCEKNIEPSDGKNTLLQLTKNNPDGDITPVDGQIAFFLNRTCGNSAKSTVEVKFDSESKYGFEWNYKGEEYVLSAASVHSGKDASFGHYYTYKLESDGNWYKYNDNSVYKTTWEAIKSIIEKNGVMFTFTEKSAFEKSIQGYRLRPDTFGINKNTRVCIAGIIGDYEVQFWERRAPLQLPLLEVIQTGKDKPYTGITDQKLLNKLSGKSNPIAIIDAAKNSAQGGDGVDGAIFKAMAGEKSSVSCIQGKIAEEFPSPSGHRIQTGGCIIHDSFGIKETSPYATQVIQAVGPRINDKNSNKKNWEKELYSAYYNSFVLGIRKGIKKFITAPISLGIFCSVTKTDEAKKVGEKAANILLHAINDAEKSTMIGKNIEVYVTDHNPDDKSRNDAENAFIQALYGYFPLSKSNSSAVKYKKAKLREIRRFANHN